MSLAAREVFVFRHGETDWNRDLRLQGHTDIPLNETGRAQAALLAEKILRIKPEVIVTSDLSRARETAEIANRELKVPIVESVHLRETRLGDCEGWYRDKVIDFYGTEKWERWQSIHPDHLDFGFPNGETKRQHLDRVTEFIKSFFAQNPHYTRIALSTHGGSVRRLVHACLSAPGRPIALPNCVLYRVTMDQSGWHFGGLVE